MNRRRLTEEQIRAMRIVINGADIYNRLIAVRLREVREFKPNMITIERERHVIAGEPAQPFFFAALTPTGKAFIGMHT